MVGSACMVTGVWVVHQWCGRRPFCHCSVAVSRLFIFRVRRDLDRGSWLVVVVYLLWVSLEGMNISKMVLLWEFKQFILWNKNPFYFLIGFALCFTYYLEIYFPSSNLFTFYCSCSDHHLCNGILNLKHVLSNSEY